MNHAALKNLFGLSLAEIEGLMKALGEPAFRAAQIYSWLYARRVRGIDVRNAEAKRKAKASPTPQVTSDFLPFIQYTLTR